MYKKAIIQDIIRVWLLFTGCVLGGLLINETRSTPMPLIYSSPKARLDQTVAQLGISTLAPVVPDGDVDLDELQQISSNRMSLILDARPEIFYRMGHIPSALSLPRDDFEKQYQSLQATLHAYHNKPLIVYCSGRDCHDSQMVADALLKLGYLHVRLFRGGWSDWEEAGLPEEKE